MHQGYPEFALCPMKPVFCSRAVVVLELCVLAPGGRQPRLRGERSARICGLVPEHIGLPQTFPVHNFQDLLRTKLKQFTSAKNVFPAAKVYQIAFLPGRQCVGTCCATKRSGCYPTTVGCPLSALFFSIFEHASLPQDHVCLAGRMHAMLVLCCPFLEPGKSHGLLLLSATAATQRTAGIFRILSGPRRTSRTDTLEP